MAKTMRYVIQDKKRFIGLSLLWIDLLLLGLVVRLPWVSFLSPDYLTFLKPCTYLMVEDGYAVFSWNFSNYNVPYLYLLSLSTVLLSNISAVVVVKAISIFFDFVLAFFVYKCVSFKYGKSVTIPCLAALVTLLLPSVIFNSSVLGQCDSIYTVFLVACLYALLRRRQAWAFIAFGLSFAFKLQAVFLAPLFLWMLMKKQVNWRYFLLSPLVYLVTLIPAWLFGRPLRELLLIYIDQGAEYSRLSERAPNLYQWIPNQYYSWYPLGIVFTALVVLGIALLVFKSRVNMTGDLLVYLATFSVLIVPFLLPKMHDRYFFPADVIAVIFAFYFPKYWPTPVVIGSVSVLAYLPFLYGVTPVPLPLLAVFLLILIVVLGRKLLRTLNTGPLWVQDKKRFIKLSFIWFAILLLGLIVRLPGISFISWDYIFFLHSWYNIIVDNGLASLQRGFYNQNVPYLYLLSLASILLPNISALVAVKAISIIFDFTLAFFVYKCVALKYSRTETVPLLAALVTILLPSVILNGSVWGQCDSIYTVFLVACLYALLRRRQAWAFIAFGLSFAFKLQAVFLAPLFLWMLMKKQVNWRYFLLSPLVYLVTLIPAWLFGRPLRELLLIYIDQGAEYSRLSERAPNLYQWIPNQYYSWYPLGIVFTALVVLGIALLVFKSRVNMTGDLLVYLATFSVLIVPFLLPKMHDRYFFPADVIAVIFAFYFPKYWPTPVVIGSVSVLAYLPFLYGVTPVPLPLLAVFLLILIVVLGRKLLRTLNIGTPPASTLPTLTAGGARPG